MCRRLEVPDGSRGTSRRIPWSSGDGGGEGVEAGTAGVVVAKLERPPEDDVLRLDILQGPVPVSFLRENSRSVLSWSVWRSVSDFADS